MKATNRNSRTNKQGFVYNADHNTRKETRERQDHIDNSRIKDNRYWYYDTERDCMVATRIGFSAREKEIAAYKKLYQKGLDAKNEYYKKQGHPEKCKTIEQVYSNKRTCPLETVLQIGNRDEHVTGEELQRAVIKYLNEFQRRYKGNIQILSVALHMDESVPHFHIRYTFMAHNEKTNLLVPNQTKAFEELHIERANTSRPKDRHNNALTTFSDINRKMFYDTIEQTLGIKINRDVESPSQRHKEKLEWQVEELQNKLETMFKLIEDIKLGEVAKSFLEDFKYVPNGDKSKTITGIDFLKQYCIKHELKDALEIIKSRELDKEERNIDIDR